MKDYIQKASRTNSNIYNIQDNEQLLHAGIGLATEAVEFLDALKKSIFYGKKLDKVNLKEELGDMLWYMALAMKELDTDFNTEMKRNIEKLSARYPKKFSLEKSENRDIKTEREILEK